MIAERLKIGDTIGLISPSSIADPDKYARNKFVLESLGFKVKVGKNVFSSSYGYSASEYERAEDFNAMIADDAVKMVLFGGGEGGNELLPYIEYEAIKTHPKLISSYSDGTTILNAIYAKTGLVTYYGQTPGIFADLRYYDYTQFASHFISGNRAEFRSNGQWRTITPGCCEGLLIGGYTRNFAMLTGSPYFSYDEDKKYILFLEDHEHFSELNAVSAYLAHIAQSGFFKNVAGLLFGHYSETHYPALFEMLERFGEKYNLPVAYCDDFGHGVNHAVLPIGVTAELDTAKKTLRFTDTIV